MDKEVVRKITTTPGRMLLLEILPRNAKVPFDLISRLLTKNSPRFRPSPEFQKVSTASVSWRWVMARRRTRMSPRPR